MASVAAVAQPIASSEEVVRAAMGRIQSRFKDSTTVWDGQWLNWDDLGGEEPPGGGWGDIGD